MGYDTDHSINSAGYSSMNIDSQPLQQPVQQQQTNQLLESLPYNFYQQNQTSLYYHPHLQQQVVQQQQQQQPIQQQQQQSSLYYHPHQQSMVYPPQQQSAPLAAPPQFDNAHDLKRCLKCTKIYYHIDSFNNQACSYHRDNYVKSEERWLCCNRIGREASPCFSTYHVEDENTSQILRSMVIPKPEVVQSNNPIYQNINFGFVGAERILYEGILKKQGKRLGFWEKRRFRLTFSSLINYHDESDKQVHRVFQLADIAISFRRMSTDDGERICLVINDGTRNHYLYSTVQDQTEAWIDALHTQKKICLQAKSNQKLSTSPPTSTHFSFSPSSNSSSFSFINYPSFGNSSNLNSSSSGLGLGFSGGNGGSNNNSFNNYNNITAVGGNGNGQGSNQNSFNNLGNITSAQPNIPIINNYFNNPSSQLSSQFASQSNQGSSSKLNDFGIDDNYNSNNGPTAPANINNSGNTNNNIQWIQHKVQTSDTLAGIAIRYNTTIDIIKRTNLIKGDHVISHQTLLVPVSGSVNLTTHAPLPQTEEEKRRKLVNLFAVSENLSKEESRAYLINNDWDMTRALRELKEDLEWEHHNPYPTVK